MEQYGTSFQEFSQSGSNLIQVENAVIDEVYYKTCESGYILITYTVPLPDNSSQREQIRLNISQYTLIISQYGEPQNLCDLDVSMHINAVFSAAVTRSIPPQSSAYSITVL